MPHYAAFGLCLDTDVELPGLRPMPSRHRRWTLRTAAGTPAPAAGAPLGREAYPGCVRTLHRDGGTLHYRHSCTGTFAIAPADRRITWWPAARAHPDSVGADVVGRVLAVALHAEGCLCLHASAVTVDGAVLAFLATTGTGKSTLAAALANAGARLLADDMLAVALPDGAGARPCALPGLDVLRLCDDAAERLCRAGAPRSVAHDGKHVLAGLAAHEPPRRRPIAALYLLRPAAGDAPAPQRTRLAGAGAAIALLPHLKVGPLLGATDAADVLDRVAALAAAVPVLHLDVPRRLDRVADVAARIVDWHAAPRRAALAW